MIKTYMANQLAPYELISKRIKLPKDFSRLRSLASIVLLTHPNYNEKNIEDMFYNIKQNGCTYATFTNAIIEQLGRDKDLNLFLEEFQNLFGYSLYDAEKNIIDYNRLLVDLYSTLYKIGELSAFWYNRYSYKSEKEAAINLGIIKAIDEITISNKLYDNGYMADGFDENGKLVFKDIKNPVKIEHIGTYQELAQKVAKEPTSRLFNKDFSNSSNDEIKRIFKDNNIQIGEKCYEVSAKLSGLTTTDVNFWLNEFFKRRKIDVEINVQDLAWCSNSPEELLEKINEALENGASISVSSDHNCEIYMKNLKEKFLPWVKLENDRVGHAMFLKEISDEEDLIVSSWGDDYLIPIDYCGYLHLNSIFIKHRNYDLAEQIKNGVIK